MGRVREPLEEDKRVCCESEPKGGWKRNSALRNRHHMRCNRWGGKYFKFRRLHEQWVVYVTEK